MCIEKKNTTSYNFFQFSLLLTFRSTSSPTMDDKKQYLSASGYNLHGSQYSINLPGGGTAVSGYRGSNEFIREF